MSSSFFRHPCRRAGLIFLSLALSACDSASSKDQDDHDSSETSDDSAETSTTTITDSTSETPGETQTATDNDLEQTLEKPLNETQSAIAKLERVVMSDGRVFALRDDKTLVMVNTHAPSALTVEASLELPFVARGILALHDEVWVLPDHSEAMQVATWRVDESGSLVAAGSVALDGVNPLGMIERDGIVYVATFENNRFHLTSVRRDDSKTLKVVASAQADRKDGASVSLIAGAERLYVVALREGTTSTVIMSDRLTSTGEFQSLHQLDISGQIVHPWEISDEQEKVRIYRQPYISFPAPQVYADDKASVLTLGFADDAGPSIESEALDDTEVVDGLSSFLFSGSQGFSIHVSEGLRIHDMSHAGELKTIGQIALDYPGYVVQFSKIENRVFWLMRENSGEAPLARTNGEFDARGVDISDPIKPRFFLQAEDFAGDRSLGAPSLIVGNHPEMLSLWAVPHTAGIQAIDLEADTPMLGQDFPTQEETIAFRSAKSSDRRIFFGASASEAFSLQWDTTSGWREIGRVKL